MKIENQIIEVFKILNIAAMSAFIGACSHSAVANRDLATPANFKGSGCEITSNEKEALLKLDYQSFDQSLPDGGWRKYENQGCFELTRELIDAYTEKHQGSLLPWQKNVLIWHSGQISGMLNDYSGAIVRMEQTLKKDEKPDDAFLWNPYVRSTISFLKKDKKSLIKERAKLAKGSSPSNHINLRIVDSFVRCFDASYMNAYSKNCDPKETNEERIGSLAIRFDLKKPIAIGINEYFQQKKLILVGEIHGTQEVPELFGKIVSSVVDEKSKTLVILEIDQSSQENIDRFLNSGDESILQSDDFFTRKYQDGRSSKAMVGLLKKLAKMPNTKVLCMDPMTGIQSMTGQERDTAMASFIHAQMPHYDRTLVLSGNVHSSVVVGTPWDKDFRPMGYELMKLAKGLQDSEVANFLVRYEKVDSWNCQGVDASSCSARYGKNHPTDYSSALNWNSYFLQEDALRDGHRGTIFIRSTQVSFPFVR